MDYPVQKYSFSPLPRFIIRVVLACNAKTNITCLPLPFVSFFLFSFRSLHLFFPDTSRLIATISNLLALLDPPTSQFRNYSSQWPLYNTCQLSSLLPLRSARSLIIRLPSPSSLPYLVTPIVVPKLRTRRKSSSSPRRPPEPLLLMDRPSSAAPFSLMASVL